MFYWDMCGYCFEVFIDWCGINDFWKVFVLLGVKFGGDMIGINIVDGDFVCVKFYCCWVC